MTYNFVALIVRCNSGTSLKPGMNATAHEAAFPRESSAAGGKSYVTDAARACRAGNHAYDAAAGSLTTFSRSVVFFPLSVAIMEIAAEWPYDKVLQLIALFQQRPMLWDTRCEDYKDRQKRREATVELAAHFHVERNEIERKLKNLQSHFYREVKKEEQWSVCRGSSAAYRSKWFAYRAMRFLVDKDKLKRNQIAAGGMTPVLAQRQKSTEMARGSAMRTHSDKSRRYLVGTRLRSSGKKTAYRRCRLPAVRRYFCLASKISTIEMIYIIRIKRVFSIAPFSIFIYLFDLQSLPNCRKSIEKPSSNRICILCIPTRELSSENKFLCALSI